MLLHENDYYIWNWWKHLQFIVWTNNSHRNNRTCVNFFYILYHLCFLLYKYLLSFFLSCTWFDYLLSLLLLYFLFILFLLHLLYKLNFCLFVWCLMFDVWCLMFDVLYYHLKLIYTSWLLISFITWIWFLLFVLFILFIIKYYIK